MRKRATPDQDVLGRGADQAKRRREKSNLGSVSSLQGGLTHQKCEEATVICLEEGGKPVDVRYGCQQLHYRSRVGDGPGAVGKTRPSSPPHHLLGRRRGGKVRENWEINAKAARGSPRTFGSGENKKGNVRFCRGGRCSPRPSWSHEQEVSLS